jgi:hypothetical protein
MENALIGNVNLFLAQLQGFAEVAAADQVPLPPSQDVMTTTLAPLLTFRSDETLSSTQTQLCPGDSPPPFREHYVHRKPDASWMAQLRSTEGYTVKLANGPTVEEQVGQILSACVDELAPLEETIRQIEAVLGSLAPRIFVPRNPEDCAAAEVLLEAVTQLLLQSRECSPADPPGSLEHLSTHEILCLAADLCLQLRRQEGAATAAQMQFVDAAAMFFAQRSFSLATGLFIHLAKEMLEVGTPAQSAPFVTNSFLRSLFKLHGAAKNTAPSDPIAFTSDADFTAELSLRTDMDAKSAPAWRVPLFVPPGTSRLDFSLSSGEAVTVTATGKTLDSSKKEATGVSSWVAEELPAHTLMLDRAGATAALRSVTEESHTIILLSGRLASAVRITATTITTIEPLSSIVSRTAVAVIVAASKIRLCSGLQGTGGDVYPLLASGVRVNSERPSDLAAAILSNTPGPASDAIQKLAMATRQASGWQADITRHLLAALVCFCEEGGAVKAIAQRWLQEWVELLQGAVNDQAKDALRQICRFVVERLRPAETRDASATDLLKHLRRLLVTRTTPADIEALLERQARTAQQSLPVLKLLLLLQPVCPCGVAGVVAHWLRNGDTRHYLSPFEGAGVDRTNEIRVTVQQLVESALLISPSEAFAAIASHSLDRHDLRWILEGTVLKSALGTGNSEVPDSTFGLLKQNTIFTSKSGVRVTATASGMVVVERTGMDTLPLRGTNGWRARVPAPVQYFEVVLESKSIKRAVVGVCCAADVVDSVSEIRREAKNRIAFFDTNALKRCYAGPGDVVGAGFCPASQRAFLTLNGIVLHRQRLELPDDVDVVFPFITYDTSDKSTIQVNFGQTPFIYDFRKEDVKDEATSVVHAAREAITALCRRAIAVAEPSLFSALQESVLGMSRMPSAAIRCFAALPALTKRGADMIANALLSHVPKCDPHHQRCILSALETLSERSPKSFTEAFVTKVIDVIEPLRRTLSTARPRQRVPFVPQWTSSTDSTSFIASSVVQIMPEKEYAHAVGTQLPNTGKVSFSVTINSRSGEIKPLSTLGQFYIGVTTSKVGALSNISSWKSADGPPTVWAIHSLAHSQLHHCNESAFSNDPFLFACGMPVTVEIDRDCGTMSVSRTGRSFPDVFEGIPKGAALTPFVQIIGQKTAAVILPGSQERCIDNEDLLLAQIVSLYRSLLTTTGGAQVIAPVIRRGLHVAADDLMFALSVLGSVSDTRYAESRHVKSSATVAVQRVLPSGVAEVRTLDGAAFKVDVSSLNSLSAFAAYPALRFADSDNAVEVEDDDEDDYEPERTTDGVTACLAGATQFLREWNQRVLSTAAVSQAETAARAEITQAEQQAASAVMSGHRRIVVAGLQQLNSGLMSSVLQPPVVPRTFTFSRRDSSPALQIPKHYNGKLVLTPSESGLGSGGTFIAIANESIPLTGLATVRLRVEYDWLGLLPQLRPMPLTGGFYVGLCLESYRGRQRDHTLVNPPDMWAVPSHDTRTYHLPHAADSAKNTANFFSRDTIRLLVDRAAGTMEVFRAYPGSTEKSLGIAFRNIPHEVALFPFVQLQHGRGSAMFLPDNAALPRFPENKIQFSSKLRSKNHTCDGCLNQLVETPLSAPNWYCCNQCQGFDLCPTCFNNHFHCGHTFTHMRTTSFLPSPVSDFVPGRNADCELSGAPLSLVASLNCTLDAASFNLKATIADETADASVVWGVMRRRGAPIEAELSFETRGAASKVRRTAFVGVAPLDLVLNKSQQEVLAITGSAAAKKALVAVMSTDESGISFPGAVELVTRSASRGFTLDDRLTFSLVGETLEIQRRGSLCRRYDVKWTAEEKLCVFAFFSGSGVTCSAVSQTSGSVLGKVGEVSSAKRIRVTNGTANRWTSTDQIRYPLSLVKQLNDLKEGMTVFIACPRETTDFVECTITKLGLSGEAIELHDGDTLRKASIDSLFVAASPEGMGKSKDPDEAHMYPDVKRRLRLFYKQYAPAKTDEEMDNAIALYSRAPGGHEAMWAALVKKYGPEPVPKIVLPKSRRQQTAAVHARDVVGCVAILRFLLTAMENAATKDAAVRASREVADVLQQLASLESCAVPIDRMERGARDAEASNCLVPVVDTIPAVKPSVALPDGWWRAASQQSNWIPSSATLSGRMRSSTGFSFEVTIRLDVQQGAVTFVAGRETITASFVVAHMNAMRETRAFSIGLNVTPDEKNADAMSSLGRNTAGESLKSSLFLVGQRTATLTFIGRYSERMHGVEGVWTLLNGHSGDGFLLVPGPAEGFIAPLPDILPVAAAEAAVQPTAPLLIRSLATEFARRIRLATAEATFTGGVPELLFRELSFCADREQSRAVQQLRIHSSLALEGLTQHAVNVCRDDSSSLQLCGNAARLLRSIATASGDELSEGLMWDAFHAVTYTACRHWNSKEVVECFAYFVSRHRLHPATSQLVGPLFRHFSQLAGAGYSEAALLSAACDAFVPLASSVPFVREDKALPLQCFSFLADVTDSVRSSHALPLCTTFSTEDAAAASGWKPMTPATEMKVRRLVVGRLSSSAPVPRQGSVYCEVEQEDECRVVVGVCSAAFLSADMYVGYTNSSFGFDGVSTMHAYVYRRYGHVNIVAGDIIGCRVCIAAGTISWSVNGDMFPAVAIPPAILSAGDVFLCIQAGRSTAGTRINSVKNRLCHLPHDASPLHETAVDCSCRYIVAERTTGLTAKSAKFYAGLFKTESKNDDADGSDSSLGDMQLYKQQVENISRSFQSVIPFIDLQRDSSALLSSFSVIKSIVPASVLESLIDIKPLKPADRHGLQQVTVRWFELSSPHERTPEEALSFTVLAQLHRQIGSDPELFEQTPVFTTALMMTDSGHTPIDAGGPYSQVWTLLGEEITSEDTATFHRNPLFRFTSSKNGKYLFPDKARATATDLGLFEFFGRVMGHLVRAKRCMALELSPFVWKFLTEEPVSADDYVNYVDSFIESLLEDDDLFQSEDVEVTFPGFGQVLAQLSPIYGRLGEQVLRRKVAELCIVESAMPQLLALRRGMWATLGRSTMRLLTPGQLETKVCGEPNPTFEQVQSSISCQLPEPFAFMFWEALRALSKEEWTGFFYFASAQKRYPLSKKISVTPTRQSPDHLPQASTCFAHVSVPLYPTVEKWVEKLRQASRCIDMELA